MRNNKTVEHDDRRSRESQLGDLLKWQTRTYMTKKQPSKDDTPSKTAIELLVAKYGLIGTIAVAVLGLFGTGATAYFGYLAVQTQIESPIRATLTAESRLANLATATQLPAPPPTQPPTDTPTSTPSLTPIPTLVPSLTPTAISPNYGNYTLLYPSCNCDEYLIPNEKALVRLRWGGKTAELAEKGADLIKYSVFVNGEAIDNVAAYRKPAIYVTSPVLEGDPGNSWWIYWDIPLGQLNGPDMIEAKIEAKLVTLTAIDTGWDILPVGLTKTFLVRAHTIALAPLPTVTANP